MSVTAGAAPAQAERETRSAGVKAWVGRHRWLLLGIGALGLLVAYHVWWLVRMRLHFPLDVDEAGYITFGLNDLDGLEHGGIGGLWDAVQRQPTFAPLVPLMAVPGLAIHKGILSAFSAELVALVVLACVTYAMSRRFVARPWAVLAVLVVVAMPGVIKYTREFSFALPCAAAFTGAVCAMAWSRHMTRLPMVLLWGLGGGLAVLSRSMALGFVPGLVAAGALFALTGPAGQRLRAIGYVAAGTVAGVAVAAIWYWRNLDSVLDYLRGYGYGNKASEYGSHITTLSWDWWMQELRLATQQELYFPLLLALVLVSLAALPWAIRAVVASDRRVALERALRSTWLPMLVVVAAGYLALSTTKNGGSGFAMPLVPTAVVLVVVAGAKIPLRWLRTATAVVFVAVSALQLVSFAQLNLGVDKIRQDEFPIIGSVLITDPRSAVVPAVGQDPNELTFGPKDKGWLETTSRILEFARAKTKALGYLPVIMFGTRDSLVNTNTAGLMARLNWNAVIPTGQLVPDDGDDTAVYAKALNDPNRGQPNILITSDSELNDFNPKVTQSKVVAAARRDGFTPFAVVRQPNGERLTLWWLKRGPTIPSPPSPPAPAAKPAG